jgi:hypothetical protein
VPVGSNRKVTWWGSSSHKDVKSKIIWQGAWAILSFSQTFFHSEFVLFGIPDSAQGSLKERRGLLDGNKARYSTYESGVDGAGCHYWLVVHAVQTCMLTEGWTVLETRGKAGFMGGLAWYGACEQQKAALVSIVPHQAVHWNLEERVPLSLHCATPVIGKIVSR